MDNCQDWKEGVFGLRRKERQGGRGEGRLGEGRERKRDGAKIREAW